MTNSTTFTHELLLLHNFHPRKFLLNSSLYQIEIPAISPTQQNNHSMISNFFHANAAIISAVLICTMISSFGLFCVLKCVRGSNSVAAESGVSPSVKLDDSGVEIKVLNAFPIVEYATELKLPGLDTACVICLSEFADGERLRILPKCNHGFHTRCIDTWLSSHSSCPTCRHCLTESDHTTSNSGQTGTLQMHEIMNIEVN